MHSDIFNKLTNSLEQNSAWFLRKEIDIFSIDLENIAWKQQDNSYFTSDLTSSIENQIDPYEFVHKNPLGETIGTMFPLQMIRSKIAKFSSLTQDLEGWGWHIDENPCCVLRINIPIITDPNYLLQLDGYEPIHLEVGYAYSWNTSIPHRIFSKNPSYVDRIHLVLGFSPWFFYEDNQWNRSQYYKQEPEEILRTIGFS